MKDMLVFGTARFYAHRLLVKAGFSAKRATTRKGKMLAFLKQAYANQLRYRFLANDSRRQGSLSNRLRRDRTGSFGSMNG